MVMLIMSLVWDDLRQFCNNNGKAMPVYTTESGKHRVEAIYPYAIGATASPGYIELDISLFPKELKLPGGGNCDRYTFAPRTRTYFGSDFF
jgi:hypothetical protein